MFTVLDDRESNERRYHALNTRNTAAGQSARLAENRRVRQCCCPDRARDAGMSAVLGRVLSFTFVKLDRAAGFGGRISSTRL